MPQKQLISSLGSLTSNLPQQPIFSPKRCVVSSETPLSRHKTLCSSLPSLPGSVPDKCSIEAPTAKTVDHAKRGDYEPLEEVLDLKPNRSAMPLCTSQETFQKRLGFSGSLWCHQNLSTWFKCSYFSCLQQLLKRVGGFLPESTARSAYCPHVISYPVLINTVDGLSYWYCESFPLKYCLSHNICNMYLVLIVKAMGLASPQLHLAHLEGTVNSYGLQEGQILLLPPPH